MGMPARLSAMCISISAEELQTQPSLVASALISPRRFRLRRNRSCPVRHFHHLQRGFLIAPSGHHARRTANDLFGKVWSLENTVNSAPCEQLGNSFKLMKISPWGCKKSPLCPTSALTWQAHGGKRPLLWWRHRPVSSSLGVILCDAGQLPGSFPLVTPL